MKDDLHLRPTEEGDMELLYKWRNDEECRKNFFSTEIVPLEEHKQWFAKMLKNPNEYAYILLNGKVPVGQVRLSVNGRNAEISYSIASEHRKKGYGVAILQLVEEIVFQQMPDVTLVGEVKDINIASQRVFESLGYERQSIIVYRKRVFAEGE